MVFLILQNCSTNYTLSQQKHDIESIHPELENFQKRMDISRIASYLDVSGFSDEDTAEEDYII